MILSKNIKKFGIGILFPIPFYILSMKIYFVKNRLNRRFRHLTSDLLKAPAFLLLKSISSLKLLGNFGEGVIKSVFKHS